MVGSKEWEKNYCRFSGCLPESGKDVLVRIQCDDKSGSGEIVIFCDSAMALNSLLAYFKKAIHN